MRGTNVLAILLVSITVAYALLRAPAFLFGPSLEIFSPEPNTSVPQHFTLDGQVRNSVFLSVNDRRLYPDREGYFRTDVVLPTGHAIVKIYARNRQRRETVIHIPLHIRSTDNEN